MDSPATALFSLEPEVREALRDGRPVVALESAMIAQFPATMRVEAARRLEAAVRDGGAIPATVACVDGVVRVGLDDAALELLARSERHEKVGLAALPRRLAQGGVGVTTVASTVTIAARVGIPVFATGGIGGVHHGAAETFDVSADLGVLAREPVVVVCSGAKSILDVAATLEALEALGVPVVGYGVDRFPGFLADATDHPVPELDAAQIARLRRAQRALGLRAALVVGCAPPPATTMPQAVHDAALAEALAAARAAGIRGSAVSPFLLERMQEARRRALAGSDGGDGLVSLGPARAGAEIAVALGA